MSDLLQKLKSPSGNVYEIYEGLQPGETITSSDCSCTPSESDVEKLKSGSWPKGLKEDGDQSAGE